MYIQTNMRAVYMPNRTLLIGLFILTFVLKPFGVKVSRITCKKLITKKCSFEQLKSY